MRTHTYATKKGNKNRNAQFCVLHVGNKLILQCLDDVQFSSSPLNKPARALKQSKLSLGLRFFLGWKGGE